MSSAYRSAYDHIVGLKLEEAREAHAKLAPMLPGLRDITQARLSRIIGGSVGIAFAGLMCWCAATTNDETATEVLVGGVIALAVSWTLARVAFAGAGRFMRVESETTRSELSGELERDLALIEANDLRREVRAIEARASRLEVASIALPIAGITFLAPLFLHWLVSCVLGSESARGFSEWIRISLVIVGHAHVALAVLGYLFARRVHRLNLATVTNLRIHREWAKMWLITIGVSCLPGIVLILVPPLLVAVTAIVFVPFMIVGLRASVVSERRRLFEAYPQSDAKPFLEGLNIPAALRELELDTARVRVLQEEQDRLAEKEEGEPDRQDEYTGSDTGDRAQA